MYAGNMQYVVAIWHAGAAVNGHALSAGCMEKHCQLHTQTIPQDVPSSEVLWYHVIFVAVMFLLIGLDLVVTRLCQ